MKPALDFPFIKQRFSEKLHTVQKRGAGKPDSPWMGIGYSGEEAP